MALDTQKNSWLARKEFALGLDVPATSALATNGVIPAGSIYPANDATAVGIIVNDTELGDKQGMAVLVKGVVYVSLLPVAPSTAALNKLKANGIQFISADTVL